ncbi:FMNH2-utilizing oxygenase [Sphaerisporangium siamense]|uniref:Alkanesulfonate monooxygenase SsuD/methylene tetrahydromethanopterin reductase-like flavin-dependent oxidoreductase (Luciferase family) n=1 Tax=Sphaerisporangium siamense TaxID=795645 RepID=A0A7W7GCN6_9ACTN|nr:LLM class flavin-dependent oxidoreductase [Sphaerisporangium siamense]MBB4704065.1 alkanesulfonate monooxygenase SsuD/methylene tetrahydromethanopterin reductase-like flavin-dependent oxidoreductase (luciferase family) [Sphaerisporangium siamense]GII82540.1 FMNH2-utilizing oxygenase [Sphaerisporangium siamense]
MPPVPLHLSVALEGAGWHPAAWRHHDARPRELFSAGYWTALAAEAERGLLDFVTIEDSLGLQSSRHEEADGRTDQVRGRLDAVLLAARLAPATSRIGLVPTATVTHTEPFHVAIGIATVDHVSHGRAGWRAQISPRHAEAGHFGRRTFPVLTADGYDDPALAGHVAGLFAEAEDAVEVARRLWDSWEDDAVIRDVPTGRYVDRDKLHSIDFQGRWFGVRGPSITPRPPQGRPIVAALAHGPVPYGFAARAADVVFVTPRDKDDARSIVAQVRAAEGGRAEGPLRIFADLEVHLETGATAAAGRKARLDELDGAEHVPDVTVFTGTPEGLAGLLLDWREAGLDGFRLRPGVLPSDLAAVTRGVVPALQAAGAFRGAYEAATLRELLGLPHPANRYAAARG